MTRCSGAAKQKKKGVKRPDLLPFQKRNNTVDRAARRLLASVSEYRDAGCWSADDHKSQGVSCRGNNNGGFSAAAIGVTAFFPAFLWHRPERMASNHGTNGPRQRALLPSSPAQRFRVHMRWGLLSQRHLKDTPAVVVGGARTLFTLLMLLCFALPDGCGWQCTFCTSPTHTVKLAH